MTNLFPPLPPEEHERFIREHQRKLFAAIFGGKEQVLEGIVQMVIPAKTDTIKDLVRKAHLPPRPPEEQIPCG